MGEGLDEIGRRADTGSIVVQIDPRFPTCGETLLTMAQKNLAGLPVLPWNSWLKR